LVLILEHNFNIKIMKKMQIINKSKIAPRVVAFFISTVFLFSSCDQQLDINTDPNELTKVPNSTLLSTAEVKLAYTLGGEATRMPANIVQHYAGHRGQPNEYTRYFITPSATDRLWSNIYDILIDMRAVEVESAKTNDKVFEGISQILQAYTFSVATDIFGDIPYTESLQLSKNITPAYDKQEVIYPALITLIENGIANVSSNQGLNPGDSDVIYKGSTTKWAEFGNSLKLRLLNHLSKRNPAAALTFLQTNPRLITTSANNAKVTFLANPANANPIHQFDVLSGRKDNAVANTIIDKMKSLSDPRIPVYFYPVTNGPLAGQYLGNKPGGDDDDSGETRFSRTGSAYASIDSPVTLLSAAEVHFIRAEVYFRATNVAEASSAYTSAITADLASLGLSTSTTSYLANPLVTYNGTLARIMEQKWITMFQGSNESWVDWRRTGLPVLTPPINNRTSNVIPRRLPYPQIEINVNGTSLAAGPGIPIPFVSLGTKVWWDL
jgi:hypothetical protein